MPQPKVAVLHPGVGFGGSEAPVMWTLEALKGHFDVTLVSTGAIDLARLNAYYGTNLTPTEFKFQSAPLPAVLGSTAKFAGLKGSFFQRYVRRIASEFDVPISCYGPMDFGRRGIQMIADFSFVDEWRFTLNPGVRSWKRWWYGRSPLRRLYLSACAMVSQADPEGWKQNLTLANSDWSANLLRQKYRLESQTLYPPVEGDFPQVPFAERENGFVCLGRISPEKRVDAVIDILSQVRRRGHNVHLHILGGVDDSPYGAMVKSLAGRNRDWVFLEGWAIGERKKHLLSSHRYGIHGRQNEPFGIAVGEMVNAGCIVFAPGGGGQVEILNHPGLISQNDRDAVEKIHAVLADDTYQAKLRAHLAGTSNAFSAESFKAAMCKVVTEFLALPVAPCPAKTV